jgi:hypothetical protein
MDRVMTLHTQVVLILLVGLATLYIVFGTKLLFDPKTSAQRQQIAQTFPLWLSFLAMMGLACTVFGAQFLLFGTRQPPQPYTFIAIAILCAFIFARALIKHIRAR